MTTHYHAKYFAHELSRRHSAADSEKLAGALLDAQVDLNPHQLEAALFAFRSPLSKGAILADEVGLGKTIEAGLVLSQKWAEGKRRILIVTPANLRKQCSQEMAEKFFLPTMILEAKNYNQLRKSGACRPLEQNVIVICSYQFSAKHEEELMTTRWDLVVMDEAHRLPEDTIRRLFEMPSQIAETGISCDVDMVRNLVERRKKEILADVSSKQSAWLDEKLEKLNRWTEDKRHGLKAELKDFDDRIAELKKLAQTASSLPEKIELQKKLRDLDKKRDEAWREYDGAARDIERHKDKLLDGVEEQLRQKIADAPLFAVHWTVS